jgi:hypothetical protein
MDELFGEGEIVDESHQHHLQPPQPPTPSQIQAQPTSADASTSPAVPDYNFRKRRWKLWALLTLSLIFLVGVGIVISVVGEIKPVLPDPGPPFSAEEARQALLEITNDPYLVGYPAAKSSLNEPAVEHAGVVQFGDYSGHYFCDLYKRVFGYYTRSHYDVSHPRRGRFVYENGRWKAKIGGTGDFRRLPQVAG